MSQPADDYREELAAGRTLHAGSVMLAAKIAKAGANGDANAKAADVTATEHGRQR
jgi:hypothetical protein